MRQSLDPAAAPSVDRNSLRDVLGVLATNPHPKDLVLAILGASAGAGGLVLVFVGILVSTIAGYPGGTSRATLRPYRAGAWAAVGVFGLSLLTIALSVLWLAVSDTGSLYVLTIFMFFVLLATLLALAAAVVKATV
jgi:hypothetical protein